MCHIYVCREQWLQAAKSAFDEIERKGGTGVSAAGTVRSSHLIDILRARLPANEVEYAVEDALLEAGAVGEATRPSLSTAS